ncbi:MAG TPA: nuclear transport factor 2 family protein [Candidatus Limnocylindrales bacterium]|nr:nuclear transport factor 2 family protein [Candidatus Limnocylindrales bacterium]
MSIDVSEIDARDRAAVAAVATDYIEAWLDGDADRMARALHPALAKRSVATDGRDAGRGIDSLTASEMVEATLAGRGRRHAREFTVEILDAYRDVASVVVRSVPYVDYLHVARVDGRWQIVNVLWQSRRDDGTTG